MTLSDLPFGVTIAAKLPPPAQIVYTPPDKLQTVLHVLTALEKSPYYGMMRTTSMHIAGLFKVPVDQLPIKALLNAGPALRKYLKDLRYSRNSIRSYSNFASMLLRYAEVFGWSPPETPDVRDDWKDVLAAMPKTARIGGLIQFAIRLGKAPAEFTDADLDAWAQAQLENRRSYGYVVRIKSSFRRALSEYGLRSKFPGIVIHSEQRERYGIPLRDFPKQLRAEVEALLEWKQVQFAPGRPPRSRIRPVTAARLQQVISHLYGFATTIEQRVAPSTLKELFTEKSVIAFTQWSLNVRKLKGQSVTVDLYLLCGALRHHPEYRDQGFDWMSRIASQIQPDSESEKRERKEKKYVPYEVLQQIPARMHAQRKEVQNLGDKHLAWLVHDELLLSWLVTLLWRQLNIRGCGLANNLRKDEIPTLVIMALPQWTRDRLKTNPHERFWQFHFREKETKTKSEIRSILPRKLVPLLEEYLEHHRLLLVGDPDPGTLFLNRHGGPLTRDQVTALVSNLIWKYAKKRVTPHLFRDIFAYYWLDHNPGDYLTLSKMLWHKDIKTTISFYGGKFDESHALCKVEEWFDRNR